MSVLQLSELSLYAINETFLIYCIMDNFIKKSLNIPELDIYQLFKLVNCDDEFSSNSCNIYEYFKQICEKNFI